MHVCVVTIDTARFKWQPNDPEIVSDVLFAIANVLSIARTTYLMPAFEVLGPLQISLGRMIGDITRFLVLFTLVRSKLCALTRLCFLCYQMKFCCCRSACVEPFNPLMDTGNYSATSNNMKLVH